jgi:hypothetical protein
MVIVSVVLGTTPLPTNKKPLLPIQVADPQVFQKKVKDVKPATQDKLQQPIAIANQVAIAAPPPPAPVAPPPPKVQAAAKPVVVPLQSGTCTSWMAAAGIVDTANASQLLTWESHCNPNAINPSSGACGLAQELPCGKSGCSLGDGACQMVWFNKYVIERYGTMAAAVDFHVKNGWY